MWPIWILILLCSATLNAFAQTEQVAQSISGATTITAEQAKTLYDAGVQFIDVRSVKQWQQGHIEGALSLDLESRFSQLTRINPASRTLPIVVYDNSSYHHRGILASYLASLWGYENVFFFRSGYYVWLAADLPVTLWSDRASSQSR